MRRYGYRRSSVLRDHGMAPDKMKRVGLDKINEPKVMEARALGARVEELPLKSTICFWESPLAFVEAVRKANAWNNEGSAQEGLTTGEVYDQARNGRTDLVAAAEALMDKLSLDVESPRRVRRHGMAGSWPDVPRALAGDPDSMWRTEEDRSARAPVRIVFDKGALSSIPHSLLEKRGVTVLALVMAAQVTRPVELWVGSGLGARGTLACSHLSLMKVGTSPLDLAAACFAACSPGLARKAAFGWSKWMLRNGVNEQNLYIGDGCFDTSYGAYDNYAAAVKAAFADDGTRLFIVPRIMEVGNDPVLTDPLAFIEKALANDFGKREEDE